MMKQATCGTYPISVYKPEPPIQVSVNEITTIV